MTAPDDDYENPVGEYPPLDPAQLDELDKLIDRAIVGMILDATIDSILAELALYALLGIQPGDLP